MSSYNIHPIVDGQCHPMEVYDGHPNVDGPLMEVYDGHPNVDGQCHPFSDVY